MLNQSFVPSFTNKKFDMFTTKHVRQTLCECTPPSRNNGHSYSCRRELMDNDLDTSRTKAKKTKQSLAKLSLKHEDTIKSNVPLGLNVDVCCKKVFNLRFCMRKLKELE